MGVGLDGDNVVDLLKPGMPAEKGNLKMGDRVTHWNGITMTYINNGVVEQRLLKDVVKPAETHTVVVERARKPWQSDSWEKSSWETGSWETPSWG